MDIIPADILAKYGQGFVMDAIPKGLTWDILGDKYPDFWSKGTANCTAYPDLMFPEGYNSHPRELKATEVCNGCPYIKECLQFALENDEWGVWGGMTRHQRRPLRKALGYV
jgi:hypothetical protein